MGAFASTAALLLMTGCASEPSGQGIVAGNPPTPFREVLDNVRHDTLLVQVTYDMGDGSYVMVAGNRDDTFEGLRLYRYRANPDSSAQVLAVSSPGYDSWTMLPTFFAPSGASAKWILANFGERESWGQKLIRLDTAFHDLGFLDAAVVEWISEDGQRIRKRRNIGPSSRLEFKPDSIWVRFDCDSVYLYDDQAGVTDITLQASRVRYLHTASEGLSLWVDGDKRLVKLPG